MAWHCSSSRRERGATYGIHPNTHTHAPSCRELSSASITRIHCNKATIVSVESDFLTKEVKAIFVLFEGVTNRHDFLRNDRQDLNVNMVEFVEAGPHSSLRKSREEFLHHLIIKTIRAVENHDWICKSFAETQTLSCLCQQVPQGRLPGED